MMTSASSVFMMGLLRRAIRRYASAKILRAIPPQAEPSRQCVFGRMRLSKYNRGRAYMPASRDRRFLILCAASLVTVALDAVQVQPPPPITFTDVTAQAGITFVHHNGAPAGNIWYPELFGGGVVVLDIDADSWPDLLFVDGKDWRPGGRPKHGLYRNNHDGTFKDVTVGSGLDTVDLYGLGASVADYDNDGRDDLFITTVDGGR